MKIGEIIELNIEKLTYGGDGLGRINGTPVFVADTAPGDIIKAKIISLKKNYAKAIIQEIIEPSKNRIYSFCPLSKVCGGCQWTYIDYEEQLRSKKQIVQECLSKISGLDIPVKDLIKSDETTEYRCKIQYPVQQTKVSKRFLAGYYKKGTHEIVNLKYCPNQPAIIDEITEFLRKKAQDLNLTAYNEKTKKGLIRHFVFRYSKTNKDLILTIVINLNEFHSLKTSAVYNDDDNLTKKAGKIEYETVVELCNCVKDEFPMIKGVLINYNTTHSNIIMGNKTELICGKDYIEEILDDKKFIISAESFFQVNPLTAKKMFSEVRRIVKEKIEKPEVLDVYSGSGSFSIYLSDIAANIVAVEESESSVEDGIKNLKLNKIENINFIKVNADDILVDMSEKQEKFDVILLDPPRKGCSESVLNSIKKLAPKYIIYISCNPSTLARDIKLLQDDFIPEFVQPVDMFCHTYHVESILLLSKK